MAPVYVACRLPVGLSIYVLVFLLLLITGFVQHTFFLLVYDRSQLLSIQVSVETFFKNDYKDSHLLPPPLLEDIPCCLRRLPFVAKRCRRGRKRDGIITRLKRTFGARNCIRSPRQTTVETKGRKITWRSWEALGSWLVPAIPEKVAAPGRTAVVRVYERGVNQQNLRPLCREQQTTRCEA